MRIDYVVAHIELHLFNTSSCRVYSLCCFYQVRVFVSFDVGVSVSDVLGMLSVVLGYIPETKEGLRIFRERMIETAMSFLDWLKKVNS